MGFREVSISTKLDKSTTFPQCNFGPKFQEILSQKVISMVQSSLYQWKSSILEIPK